MPLRDVLRGVTTVADITEEVLEPATALLPRPVQSSFRSALAAVEGAGARVVTPRIDHADIRRASAFLLGTDSSRLALETFINVLAYAWERALVRRGDQRLLLSETVAAASVAWSRKVDTAVTTELVTNTACGHAVAVLQALRKANAASRLPGIPMTPTEDERAYIDQTLLAALGWLLADRATGPVEEDRLLELSLALTHALGDEVDASFANPERLAQQLQSLADHL